MRLVFLSDAHFGAEGDNQAWKLACKLVEDIAPDEVILGGDIFDHAAVSKHRKKPEQILTFQKELDTGTANLEMLVGYLPRYTKVFFYRGNHERRLENFLCDLAKPLHGLSILNPNILYQLPDLGIEYIPGTQPFRRGHLWICHGDEIATGGLSPAHTALNDVNSNVLFGHVHKFTTAGKQQLNRRTIGAWSNGCLCKLTPAYDANPSWRQGITVVDFTASGHFQVTPVMFWYDRHKKKPVTIFEGELYD